MFGIWKSNITNVHLCAHPGQDLLGGVHDLRTNPITKCNFIKLAYNTLVTTLN